MVWLSPRGGREVLATAETIAMPSPLTVAAAEAPVGYGHLLDRLLGGARVRMQYAFGPTIGSAVNVTLLTYVDTCALGIDVDTGAIPDYDVFYECLVAGFEEVLALAG